MEAIRLEGGTVFRHAILLSILSQKHVVIDKIRFYDDAPGIKDYEKNFLVLMQKVMQGSGININPTGTKVFFRPGILHGGEVFHDCNNSRGIGYYLEPLLALAPFMKERLSLTLTGSTHVDKNQGGDPSVDLLIDCALPILQKFGALAELELKIKRRSTADGIDKNDSNVVGFGEVFFTCPVLSQLKPVNIRDPGYIKKIRGVSFSINVSHHMADVMVSSAKGILLSLLPDIRIDKDVRSAKGVTKPNSVITFSSSLSSHAPSSSPSSSPSLCSGYGMVMTAISTSGCTYSAEAKYVPPDPFSAVSPTTQQLTLSPADLGVQCAYRLLDEIHDRGCISSFVQWLALCLLPLTPSGDASFVRTGPFTHTTLRFLRLIRLFLGVQFRLREMASDDGVDNSEAVSARARVRAGGGGGRGGGGIGNDGDDEDDDEEDDGDDGQGDSEDDDDDDEGGDEVKDDDDEKIGSDTVLKKMKRRRSQSTPTGALTKAGKVREKGENQKNSSSGVRAGDGGGGRWARRYAVEVSVLGRGFPNFARRSS